MGARPGPPELVNLFFLFVRFSVVLCAWRVIAE